MKELLRPISTVAFLSLLLAFVYMQSQSIDLERFQKAQYILAKMEAQGSQLENSMLRIYNGDVAHYDALKYALRALEKLKNQLQPLIPEQQKTFAQLQKKYAIQAATVEQFVTDQSVLVNSLRV